MQCSLCAQLVLDKKEMEKNKPLCYYHSKVRDGLISKSHLTDAEVDWLARDQLRKKYLGYPKHIVTKYVPQNVQKEIGFDDLVHIAEEALLRVTMNPGSSSTYIFSHIKGAVLNYVRRHQSHGISGISYRKYWQWVKGELDISKERDAQIFNVLSIGVQSMDVSAVVDTNENSDGTAGNQYYTDEEYNLHDVLPSDTPDPLTLLLIKEELEGKDDVAGRHLQFTMTLSRIERIVWQRHVLKSQTTRSTGYKIQQSAMTVSRVAKRVRNKFLDYWFPDKGDVYEYYYNLK